MNILGNTIREIRILKKMTQKDLAQLTGFKQNTISNHENGNRKLDEMDIKKYTEALKISPQDLFNYNCQSSSTLTLITETSTKLNEDRQLNVLDYAKKQLEIQNQVVHINEIREKLYPYKIKEKLAAASSLPDGYSYDSDYNQTFTLYSDRLINKHYDIASQVIGDSMEPQYNDGDVVLIQKGYDNINGGIYAVDYNGKTYIKKVYLDDNHFRLVSLNEKYKDIYIDLPIDEDIYFNIVGKVIDSFTPVEI